MSVIFITGVCGVGKTSLIPHLSSHLDSDKWVIVDFDQKGVPDNASREWRLETTQKWIKFAEENEKKGMNTIVCGFSRPSEIQTMNSSISIQHILLTASSDVLESRLKGRYETNKSKDELLRSTGKDLETFIMDNQNFQEVLAGEFDSFKLPVIDTSNLKPEDVANEAVRIIKNMSFRPNPAFRERLE